MPLISEKDAQYLAQEFEDNLENPVRVLMFTQTIECQFCAETRQIVEEVASLSEKVTAEIYNFVTDKATAELYGIDKIPAIAILREDGDSVKDYGIRFYGIPSGYEFTSIVEDIIDVSRGDSGLQEKSREVVAGLTERVHLQVFVTPTCPYCPQAVRLAHKLAIESDLIQADMVESVEFPHLANKYGVYGVPRTVINETIHQEGAVPEGMLLAKVLEALGDAPALDEKDLVHDHSVDAHD